MKCLMILVLTCGLLSRLVDATPGFAIDFRNLGGSRVYHDAPYRQQSRSFRETGPPTGHHQNYRTESFREYRPPYIGRDETRIFRDDSRASFKDEAREVFKEDPRSFNDETRTFRDDTRHFKDENRGFRDDQRFFRDERIYREGLRDGPRNFKEERPFREEHRPFREELRHFRDGSYRDEPRPFRDEIRMYEGPRHFRDEYRPFRNEVRNFRDESTGFREERPFTDDSGPLRNEARPFGDDSKPFKDELLFTQESQGLAEAQNSFNKANRQPLSYGGHSNYLKFGNHGLGYASIPSTILPLEDNPSRISNGMMITDMSSTASTQSPNFLNTGVQKSSSSSDVQSSMTTISVTLAPDVGSTPSQSTSGNGLTHDHQQTNQNLIDGSSTSGNANPVTVSTSVGTSVSPKVLFTSGPASISSASMGINSVDGDNTVQQGHGPTPNSLHATKEGMSVVSTPSSYFPSETRPEVPEALLNYVFKYRVPEEPKIRYTYTNSLQPETTFNQIQSVPLIQHHQTPKYTVLPELKISGHSTIQPGPTVNYVSNPTVSKVPFLTPNNPSLTLNTGYPPESVSSLNFAGNVLQLDRDARYSPIDHTEQIGTLSNQFPALGQLETNGYMSQLGQYGNLAQPHRSNNVPVPQGGLQLQLGGYGGIDLSALTGNAGVSRGSSSVNLGLGDSSRQAVSTFAKIPFGETMWRL